MSDIPSKETQTTFLSKPNRRLGNRKSKQGCLTCKARKVKCDETHPICIRCQNSDRTCLGYGDVFVTTTQAAKSLSPDDQSRIRSRSHSRSPYSPPLDFSSSPESVLSVYSDSSEARSLQYYQNEISQILGGTVDSSFWTRSILELSESEPAIRQALVAVSSLWEARVRSDVPDRYACQQRSIEQYNKALTLTAQRVAQPDADTVALGTCVLFLCMHYLDDDKEQAAKLLKTGSGVLQTVLEKAWRFAESVPANTAATFLPIFERMLLLLRLFGIDIPPFRSRDTILFLDYNFTTLDDARSMLYWLLAESHDLISGSSNYRTDPWETRAQWDHTALQEAMHRQTLHLNAYDAWKIGFDRICNKQRGQSIQTDTSISSLIITYNVAVIWTSSCFDRTEAVAERFQENYKTVIREAGKIIAYNMAADKTNIPFTFEMGLIPTLYLVALKCRDPDLRHQALSLMARAPEREGLWKRDASISIIRRVIQLETSGTEVVDGVVFRNAKICDVGNEFSDEQGVHVHFHSRLDGSMDMWKTWEETIPLRNS